MTRINVVHPSELVDKHLLAEYRELPRVFQLAHDWWARDGRLESLPRSYTLGTGHVRFFYDKLEFCRKRHLLLVYEMQSRGFQTNYERTPPILFKQLANDWKPTSEALHINRERIDDRLRRISERSSRTSCLRH